VCSLDKFNNEQEAASSFARSLNFHAESSNAEIKSRCESRFWSLESVKGSPAAAGWQPHRRVWARAYISITGCSHLRAANGFHKCHHGEQFRLLAAHQRADGGDASKQARLIEYHRSLVHGILAILSSSQVCALTTKCSQA
jgi:hypothetical protein